ncbi:DUF7552 domain-containing protein [Halobellus inordinatus]|jgi:hypothetical protein|uniref:DUF7552 domain-containing protein n=1 Tax=Halobellus inordinatus TaxID=1126236 RepID=UPI002114D32D|nr:hypothetical protein [Halobellus ramosii]
MTEPSLTALRARIEALASDSGRYVVVCGRTGEQPIPVAGDRFATREVAERAVRAAEQYRRTLRRYDDRLPYYDLIAVEDAASETATTERVVGPTT